MDQRTAYENWLRSLPAAELVREMERACWVLDYWENLNQQIDVLMLREAVANGEADVLIADVEAFLREQADDA